MLSLQSLYSTNTTSEMLANSGLQLEAIGGSPLAELVRLSCPDSIVINPMEPVACDNSGELIASSKRRDLGGNYPHDEAMAQFVQAAGVIVTGNLSVAKNLVNPIIKQVVESAVSYADQRAAGALAPMQVDTFYYPEPYNNPILGGLVDRFAEVYNKDMALGLIFNQMPAVEIRKNCLTGISSLDKDLQSWLAGLGDDVLEAVYNDVFGERARNLSEALSDSASRANRALVVYLLARRFQQDVQEGPNADLRTYNEYLSELASQAGQAVANIMVQRKNNNALSRMVTNRPRSMSVYDTYAGVVQVNGDVYDRWIKAGGVPEAIFGAIQAGDDDLSYKNLLDNAERYIGIWRRALVLAKSKVQSDHYGYFLEGMRQGLLNQVSLLPDEARVLSDQAYRIRITQHLQRVQDSAIEDPWHVGRKLVCRIFFSHTEAESILNALSHHMKSNPDLTVREAGLLATIEIVADWVIKQASVLSVKVTEAAAA